MGPCIAINTAIFLLLVTSGYLYLFCFRIIAEFFSVFGGYFAPCVSNACGWTGMEWEFAVTVSYLHFRNVKRGRCSQKDRRKCILFGQMAAERRVWPTSFMVSELL